MSKATVQGIADCNRSAVRRIARELGIDSRIAYKDKRLCATFISDDPYGAKAAASLLIKAIEEQES